MPVKRPDPNAWTLFSQEESKQNVLTPQEKSNKLVRPPLREVPEIVTVKKPEVKVTKTVFVAEVRITPEIIRKLAAQIRNEIDLADREDIFCQYIIGWKGSKYDTGSDTVFDEGKLLNENKILEVSMNFHTENNGKNIDIYICQSLEGTTKNRIEVGGIDEIWVNGTCVIFEKILEQCEKPPHLISKVGPISLIFWTISCFLYYRFIDTLSCFPKGSNWTSISLVAGTLLFGLYFYRIALYIREMFPSVELMTGPEHMNTSYVKRQYLLWIVSQIVIPVALGFVSEIPKLFTGVLTLKQ